MEEIITEMPFSFIFFTMVVDSLCPPRRGKEINRFGSGL